MHRSKRALKQSYSCLSDFHDASRPSPSSADNVEGPSNGPDQRDGFLSELKFTGPAERTLPVLACMSANSNSAGVKVSHSPMIPAQENNQPALRAGLSSALFAWAPWPRALPVAERQGLLG